MAEDIGFILFVQLLGMTQYPGSPFTGNIARDLIMFFIVPTIFIIMVVYITVGRIFVAEHARLRILLGVGMYLFIIAGGYYPAFALLAGPYFIILVFILGLLYFFVEHFTGRRQAAGGPPGGPGGPYRSGYPNYTDMSRWELSKQKKRIEADLQDVERDIAEARRHKEPRLESLLFKQQELRSELREIQHQMKFVKL